MSSNQALAEALFFEGNRHLAAAEHAAAAACFREAVTLAPQLAEAHANLGFLLEQTGQLDEAEACYRQAMAILPDCLQLYLNLGALLMARKDFGAAEALYRQALRFAAGDPALWSNLGVLLACLQRDDEAEQCHRTALAINPDYANARFNLAYVLLRHGRFDEGWASLEARDWYERLAQYFEFPRWQGEPLAGRSVLIGFEAGHGDMIQFCRYAAELKRMGAEQITVVCHPGLKTLFGSMIGVDEVYSLHDDVPTRGWDYWTPPLSLPYYCQTRLDTIPATVPYLQAEPARVAAWATRLPAARLRVGLAWLGNPRFENDADRSLSALDILAPLAAVPGIQFISLQKGRGEDVSAPIGMALQSYAGELGDFADTAALIANLDLVISVDTAVGHLAGALGKPCWLMLPDYRADWRWLTGRDDTPWYPHTRLFRQPPGGGWGPVVTQLAEALGQLAAR
ncbi:Tfp pilus assembly protein PilF [Andreprevotia lacus DSM 23236]|uniref:Tfp pilus assembly protein PilF n=1 Tax=Andreprevotia lacus DSM 23236 TaxID=1121001 RepID=A0A1W1XK39_9NEIS|nr:tetratricopeptide repeat-containing glycosyltransferase family protein [Andreprevotia lacus]SMC24353.1 Tfp pilus assembly protein PilF [Andreprevotia lacus DSM 23236]